jgi:DNA mismatch endonuclease (patch repair protein)
MADIVDKPTRSRMMSGIRGKDTKPELTIRRGLHRLGFRYALHSRRIPGRPDLVLPKYKALILVHGCFWHGHECHLFKWPGGDRAQFWRDKIDGNKQRDKARLERYKQEGWRIAVVWECSLKGRTRLGDEEVIDRLAAWLQGRNAFIEIFGS